MLYNFKFMAPMYFIISGSGAFEGAVLTIDRLGKHEPDTPPIQYVAKSPNWHLVQTNDDLLHTPLDMRRPLANRLLKSMKQQNATTEHLFQFMHSLPLFQDPGTVFTSVMVPATGFFKTILPNDPPHSSLSITTNSSAPFFQSAAIDGRPALVSTLLLLLMTLLLLPVMGDQSCSLPLLL